MLEDLLTIIGNSRGGCGPLVKHRLHSQHGRRLEKSKLQTDTKSIMMGIMRTSLDKSFNVYH